MSKPNYVDCALLYARPFKPVPITRLCDELNARIAPTGLKFAVTYKADDDSSGIFACQRLLLKINQTQAPLKPGPFADCLESPFTKVICPQAAAFVGAHRANIFASLETLAPFEDLPEHLKDFVYSHIPRPNLAPDGFLVKLSLMRQITALLIAHNRPLALHWCQSNQMMTPDYFEALPRHLPAMLYIHPRLYKDSSNTARPSIGFVTYGAAHLIGWELDFEATPVPFAWSYERAVHLVEVVRERHSMFETGFRFSPSPGVIIRLTRQPSPEAHMADCVVLTLEQAPEFGIGKPARATPATSKPASKGMFSRLRNMLG